MVYPIAKRIAGIIVWQLLKEAKGMENIPKKGPFIVASNHSSFLDPLLLTYFIVKSTNQKVHFIAYRGRFSFFGNLLIKKWAGCILIRYNKKEIKNALEEAISILKKGGIVGIFPAPEPQNSLMSPKTGVARLAIKAKCPVLPAILKGVKESFFTRSFIPRHIRHASLQFEKMLIFKKSEKNVKAATNKLVKVILRGLNKK